MGDMDITRTETQPRRTEGNFQIVIDPDLKKMEHRKNPMKSVEPKKYVKIALSRLAEN